jgi:hypothetical protein
MNIMKLEYRLYKCKNCGNVQKIQTNHIGECFDYCKGCSWRPSFGKREYQIPMFGQTYRPFVYCGLNTETN